MKNFLVLLFLLTIVSAMPPGKGAGKSKAARVGGKAGKVYKCIEQYNKNWRCKLWKQSKR